MQTTNSQPNTIEISTEKEDIAVRVLPVELKGIIPEQVWTTLTLDQKKEILRHHNIFEKYLGEKSEELSEIQTTPEAKVVAVENTPSVIVEKAQIPIEKVIDPEIAKIVAESKQIETDRLEEDKNQPVLSKEDLERIQTEKAQSASVKNYSFFGYQPSSSTLTDAKTISENNSISDSKTWAATLVAKIFSLFQ